MGLWNILGIILALIILVCIGYFLFHESPQKYYRKARRTHKKGEKAYGQGNYELASSLYVQADDYRKRARELE